MIELLTWATPNGSRPAIMLEEVGLPYTVRLVDITAGAQFAPEFLAVSPNSKIPALIDDDAVNGRRVLFESGAILLYLADKTRRLLATRPCLQTASTRARSCRCGPWRDSCRHASHTA